MVYTAFSLPQQISFLVLITSRNIVSIKDGQSYSVKCVWWENSADSDCFHFVSFPPSSLFWSIQHIWASDCYDLLSCSSTGYTLKMNCLQKWCIKDFLRIEIWFLYIIRGHTRTTSLTCPCITSLLLVDPRHYCNTNKNDTLNFADYGINW